MDESVFGKHEGANAALEELKVLFDYLEALDSLKVSDLPQVKSIGQSCFACSLSIIDDDWSSFSSCSIHRPSPLI